MRVLAASLAVLLTLAMGILEASRQAPLAFEVASVKPNASVGQSGGLTPGPGRFSAINVPLRLILAYAYDVPDSRIVDAPDWTRTARFDISAVYPQGTTPEEHGRALTRHLLADRFTLIAARESREMAVYQLLPARADGRLGPQLALSDVDCDRWLAEGRPQIRPGNKPACMMLTRVASILGGTRTMGMLAQSLERQVGRPVVDKTGLAEHYDIELTWTPQGEIPSGDAVTSNEGPSIFTALREQLGLKLEPNRGHVEVLAIQSVDRPTPD